MILAIILIKLQKMHVKYFMDHSFETNGLSKVSVPNRMLHTHLDTLCQDSLHRRDKHLSYLIHFVFRGLILLLHIFLLSLMYVLIHNLYDYLLHRIIENIFQRLGFLQHSYKKYIENIQNSHL